MKNHSPRKAHHKSADEESIHRTVVQHLKLRRAPGVLYFHVPNGLPSSEKTVARFKLLGMLPGASDLILCLPPLGRMACLELKSATGTLTDEQAEFLRVADEAGALTAVCSSLDGALKMLEAWGALKTDKATTPQEVAA